MHKLFASDFFHFEFLRVLGTAACLGAESGECLAARAHIHDGDPESWYREWTAQADQALARGEEAQATHDRVGAAWAFLRAANYYRASEFFLHCNPSDSRLLAAITNSVRAFDMGAGFLDCDVKMLEIPYDEEHGAVLPARLFLPPSRPSDAHLPLVVQMGGFDSTQEELYFYGPAGAVPRGYAVLTFEGPGQGIVLRRDGLRLRADWERVTGRVLDFVEQQLAATHGLDMARIAVQGASLGGYLAVRAAADRRVRACVSVDGCYDLFDITRSRMPGWFIGGWESGWVRDAVFNAVVGALSAANFQLRWEFAHSMWVYGVSTPAEVMRRMQQFSLKGYLARVQCSMLVTGAADTFYFTPQPNAQRIFDELAAPKQLWVGRGVEGGGLQAKIGAIGLLHQKMFAWLDEFSILWTLIVPLPLNMTTLGRLYTFMPNARVLKILAAARLNTLHLDIPGDFQVGIGNKTPEFLAKFPVGKVPAFESGDLRLAESDAIAQFVAEAGPCAGPLLGHSTAERARIRQWTCFAENEVYGPMLAVVLWRAGIRAYDADTEAQGAQALWTALGVVERQLADGREFLVAERRTMADLSLAGSLYWAWMHYLDEAAREKIPRTVAWYCRTVDDLKEVFGEGPLH